MTSPTRLRVHAEEARSRANGPGARYTVWVQGCSLGCAGCFNATTHEESGPAVSVAELADRIRGHATRGDIEGITLSGGEPLQQASAVLELLATLRSTTDLSVVLFSGYTREEIDALPDGPSVLGHLDVLIDGRYEAPRRLGTGLRGSHNQRVHLMTGRYSHADIAATPEAEIRIAPDGSFTLSGVAPVKIK